MSVQSQSEQIWGVAPSLRVGVLAPSLRTQSGVLAPSLGVQSGGVGTKPRGTEWGVGTKPRGTEWGVGTKPRGAEWGVGTKPRGAEWGVGTKPRGAEWGVGTKPRGAEWGVGTKPRGAEHGQFLLGRLVQCSTLLSSITFVCRTLAVKCAFNTFRALQLATNTAATTRKSSKMNGSLLEGATPRVAELPCWGQNPRATSDEAWRAPAPANPEHRCAHPPRTSESQSCSSVQVLGQRDFRGVAMTAWLFLPPPQVSQSGHQGGEAFLSRWGN
ncbi:hypothetical protein P7K49_013249 [Saguinus oedipus]|uniref:Uncharacterized protein n=1 Tax=Saguinus oedipus TaxID=9490 RepID=A0ABQ9VGR1_SAGOE|nr:hypothetical protein P7K49_013249 [Saguinus oedipus]